MDDQTDSTNSAENKKWIKTISDLSLADLKPKCVPGEKIGSGAVIELIGEGGMARVFKIWNEDLEMPRAVKVMLPSEKKEVADRFVTEARLTARLNHPNIILVFGVGEWDGYHFIEMEYIDGFSLDKLLTQRKSFPVYVSCAICILIARALCYAHAQKFTLYNKEYVGIIHRDLKPGNVMLHRDGRLKLMDFGIARPISGGFHTMGDNIVGTLQYLSPEQLNNKGIDQRADIYAVGAILYELLCGIKAFPDEGLTDLINKKAGGIYKPFIEFSVPIPKVISAVVDTCLQVKPDDRYADAAALLDGLTLVYTQLTCEQPEAVLKNFLHDPDYTPALPDQPKKIIQLQSSKIPVDSQLRWLRHRSVLAALIVLGILLSAGFSFVLISKSGNSPLHFVQQLFAVTDKGPVVNAQVLADTVTTKNEQLDRPSEKQMADSVAFTNKQEGEDQKTSQNQIEFSDTALPENIAVEVQPSAESLKVSGSYSQYEIAVRTLKNGNLSDAYLEIGKIERKDRRKIDLQLELIEKCLTGGDVDHASKLAFSIKSDAARLHLLRGRVLYEKNEPERALNEFENAIFASTGNKNARVLKCDILFYQAHCYELIYQKNNLPEHRHSAIRFWKQVQKYYAEKPNHSRYKLATEKIQNL